MDVLKDLIQRKMEYTKFKRTLKRNKKQIKINTLQNEIETLSNILCKRELTIKQLQGKLKKANKELKELKSRIIE